MAVREPHGERLDGGVDDEGVAGGEKGLERDDRWREMERER